MKDFSKTNRRLIFLGIGCVLLGCFLPWFRFGDLISYPIPGIQIHPDFAGIFQMWKKGIFTIPRFEDHGGGIIFVLELSFLFLVFGESRFFLRQLRFDFLANITLLMMTVFHIGFILFRQLTSGHMPGKPTFGIGLFLIFFGSLFQFWFLKQKYKKEKFKIQSSLLKKSPTQDDPARYCKMRAVLRDEFVTIAKPMFERLICSDDPYGTPFTDQIKSRILLHEFIYSLEEPWFSPILDIMHKLDEDGFYYSVLGEDLKQLSDFQYHWFVSLEDVKQRKLSFSPLEALIYSKNGRWGIMTSFDEFALFGGEDWMIEIINAHVPDMDQRINQFLDTWKYHKHNKPNLDITWVRNLLEHIYGRTKMEEILAVNDMHWLIGSE